MHQQAESFWERERFHQNGIDGICAVRTDFSDKVFLISNRILIGKCICFEQWHPLFSRKKDCACAIYAIIFDSIVQETVCFSFFHLWKISADFFFLHSFFSYIETAYFTGFAYKKSKRTGWMYASISNNYLWYFNLWFLWQYFPFAQPAQSMSAVVFIANDFSDSKKKLVTKSNTLNSKIDAINVFLLFDMVVSMCFSGLFKSIIDPCHVQKPQNLSA